MNGYGRCLVFVFVGIVSLVACLIPGMRTTSDPLDDLDDYPIGIVTQPTAASSQASADTLTEKEAFIRQHDAQEAAFLNN